MTPELCPVWCAATRGSFSTTVTWAPGCSRVIRWAVASPTMPPPTTTYRAMTLPRSRAGAGAGHPTGAAGRPAPARRSVVGDVRAVPAPPPAAGPPVRQETRRQHEQPGVRVGVAGVPGGQRRGVRGPDLRPP